MQNVFVDDGSGKKFAAVDERGDALPYHSWDELAACPVPLRVHTEDSYQAKHSGEHDRILDLMISRGHEMLAINPRVTATKRALWGEAKGTDEDDANVLRRISQGTNVHWSRVRPRGLRVPTLQQRADDLGVRGLTRLLGKYKKIEGEYLLRGALGNGLSWDKASTIFAAVALEAKDRREFLRLMGMSGNGYPSLARATFYRRVKTLVKRVAPAYDVPKPDPESPEYIAYRAGKMQQREQIWIACQSNLRRACLQMYHKIRCADNWGS